MFSHSSQISILACAILFISSASLGVAAENDDLAAIIEPADRNNDGELGPDELRGLPPEIRERLSQHGVTLDDEIPVSRIVSLLQFPTPSGPASTDSSPSIPMPPNTSAPVPGPSATVITSSGVPVPQTSGLSAAAALQARGIATTKPRVTTPLPSSHAAADTNYDGQIGLYEWRAWKGRAGLAEFHRYDRDGDGFVTPREISLGPLPNAVSAVIAPSPSSGSSASSPGTPTSSAASSASTSSGSSATGEQAELAKKYYGMLDKDRNGKISMDEWQISKRIRSAFEQGKVDLNNMNESDFVGNYVRLLGDAPR